eukprot:4288684-Amphidinium_carterae.1
MSLQRLSESLLRLLAKSWHALAQSALEVRGINQRSAQEPSLELVCRTLLAHLGCKSRGAFEGPALTS